MPTHLIVLWSVYGFFYLVQMYTQHRIHYTVPRPYIRNPETGVPQPDPTDDSDSAHSYWNMMHGFAAGVYHLSFIFAALFTVSWFIKG